jgi:hypothetical protein
MRLRYQRALESLATDGELSKDDFRLEAFLKGEKFNPLQKTISKPRMIFARSPRYNLELATYLKPLEKALWRSLRGQERMGMASIRQVGKGLNGPQRAAIIARKMANVGEGCVVFEVDGKSFEAHVTQEDLLLEHSVYRAAYPGDQHLSRMLDVQTVLKGKTMNGLKFRREGARASGDFNTGLGNSVVMLCACRATMDLIESEQGLIRHDLLVDGDNALIFVEGAKADLVWKQFAAKTRVVSPQELAVENPVDVLERVVFGQSKPVFNGENYTMVREPYKVLSNAFSGYRHYDQYTHGLRVLKCVASCELALSKGIPVLQAYFARAVYLLASVPDLDSPDFFLDGRLYEGLKLLRLRGERWADVKPTPVTAEARRSFAEAWGIDVERQLMLEKQLVEELEFPYVSRGWSGFRRWFSKSELTWESVRVTDGHDGEGSLRSIVSFLDSRH